MNSNRQLFQDHVDTDLFFGGGSRREIVEDIKTALISEVVLITLTGTDGSGKTMVCRMIEQELTEGRELLFFEQGVESFDDVVGRIAAQVNLEETEEITNRKDRLQKAIEILNREERRLIIIIDAAETIFLATLERIRRMLDEVNNERICIQLLFSGRPLISLNYKQLGIITFKPVEEKHFSLDPLDGTNTHNYLNQYLDKAGTPDQERFTPAQAEKIADVARGNFRFINQLAGRFFDSTQAIDIDESEIEELYHEGTGAEGAGTHSKTPTGLKSVDLDFLKVPKIGARWYVVGGAVLALILIFLLLTGGEEEDTEAPPGSVDVPELTLEKVEPDPIEIPQLSAPPESLPVTAPVETAPPAEKIEPEDVNAIPEEKIEESPGVSQTAEPVIKDNSQESAERQSEVELRAEAEPVPKEDLAAPKAVIVPAVEPEQKKTPPVVDKVPATAEKQPESSVESVFQRSGQAPDEVSETGEPEEGENLVGNAQSETLQIPKVTVLPKKAPSTESVPFEVVTLREESKKKLKAALSSTITGPEVAKQESEQGAAPGLLIQKADERTTAAAIEEQKPQPPEPTPSTSVDIIAPPQDSEKRTAQSRNPDVYYAERLAAGSRWLVGGSSRKYTIQLMVLNAEDAQENVREMLVEDGYQPIIDNLYILRDSRQPQTVMLYYGEFDSSEEARQARVQLPTFLNKLDPFEVAVKEAVAKARGNL